VGQGPPYDVMWTGQPPTTCFLILQARRERVYMPQDGRGQIALGKEQKGRPSCDASFLTRAAKPAHRGRVKVRSYPLLVRA
jgi:hypothetical protein